MPCAVSKEEKEYYERQLNEERYGVKDLSHRIVTTVACELFKALSEEQHAGLSKMAQKWIAIHKQEDATRG